MMNYLAADHAGFELKEKIKVFLSEKGYPFEDLGTHSTESVNYVPLAAAVAERVSRRPGETRGILVCGSGIGMAIVANKFANVRAALCHDEETARLSRAHNDANIISLGGRVLDHQLALRLVEIFLETPFDAGRHQQRLDFLRQNVENKNFKET